MNASRKSNFQALVAILLLPALVGAGWICYELGSWTFGYYCAGLYVASAWYVLKSWYSQTQFAHQLDAGVKAMSHPLLAAVLMIAWIFYALIILPPLAPLRFTLNLALNAGREQSATNSAPAGS